MIAFRSLRTQAAVLVGAICLATAAGLGGMASLEIIDVSNQALRMDTETAGEKAAESLKRIGDRINAYAGLAARDGEILDALRGADPVRRKEVFVKAFKDLVALDPVVGSLEATDANGKILIRGHRPESAGDDKRGDSLVKSALGGKAASGLTLSASSGEMAAGSVYPVYVDGKVAGTFKIGAYFNAKTAEDIKDSSGAEVALFHKGKIKSSTLGANAQVDLADAVIETARTNGKAATQLTIGDRTFETALSFVKTLDGDGILIAAMIDRAPTVRDQRSFMMWFAIKIAVVMVALMGIVVVVTGRGVRRLEDVVGVLRRFREGDFGSAIPHVELPDEIGEIARALKLFQAQGAQQALTIAAINGSDSMLMITDAQERIVFMSRPLISLLRHIEPTMRNADPKFSVDKMQGEHIDCYRINPSLQREVLSDDRQSRRVRYVVAGETIAVELSYVRDADDRVIGHNLIWRNVTAELDGQNQVAAVVNAAVNGDFSGRLTVDDKTGFVRDIAAGLNDISGLVEASMRDFADVMGELSQGNLTRRIETQYRGVLGEMSDSINTTVGRLAETVQTIQSTTVEVGFVRPRNQRRCGRPVAPHRGAGLLARRDGGDHRATRGVREGFGPVVAPGGGPGPGGDEGRRERRGHRNPGRRSHGRHREVEPGDHGYHLRHRRHRLPDEPAGAQRCGGSGARGRGRQGLRRGRIGGAHPRAAFIRGRQGDHRADHLVQRAGGERGAARPLRRRSAEQDRRRLAKGGSHRLRHLGGEPRAIQRHRRDEPRGGPHGRDDAAERSLGRAERRLGNRPDRPDPASERACRDLPHRPGRNRRAWAAPRSAPRSAASSA